MVHRSEAGAETAAAAIPQGLNVEWQEFQAPYGVTAAGCRGQDRDSGPSRAGQLLLKTSRWQESSQH